MNAMKTGSAFLLVTNDISSFWTLYYHYGRPTIKFCCCKFLVSVFRKELFLTSTTQNANDFQCGNCSVVGALYAVTSVYPNFCGIDLCIMEGL